MSEEIQNTDQQKPQSDNSAEINFAKLRKKLEAEIQEKEALKLKAAQLEKEREELLRGRNVASDDDDDDEPYVDKRKLKKELSRHGEEFEKRVEAKVQEALERERREAYLKEKTDFNDVLSEEGLKGFVESHPGVAQAILRMPDGFERQKLVYETIKDLNRLKESAKKSTIQDTIDANRRSPYYKGPSSATPPFGGQIDPKAAYNKMQELKSRLRLG